jgi:tetratricopeptide (TPR) repeat protein
MTSPNDPDKALRLVHQGWGHLQLQRPLAAWASWHQALRRVPGFPAAEQALATLESAAELPAAARAVYRFQAPRDSDRRTRWDHRLRGRDHDQLEDAADAFDVLSAEDPDDACAAYNQGLCLAWLGRNVEAIAALDHAVRLLAVEDEDFERAVEAWTLAEVLRQGGGAEALADDLRYAWIIEGADPDAVARLSGRATLVPVPTPRDPVTELPRADAEVFEWLDRPLPEKPEAMTSAALPRLQATVLRTPHALRLSSPDPLTLDEILDPLGQVLGEDIERTIRREATPLPLPLLDAALWTFRLPRGLDPEVEHPLTRGAVEAYYEDRWIQIPRKGLEGRSPLEAARCAGDDAVLRAKLVAVVRLREQLGDRPRTARLYQGYPFDRLRRRLGLELRDPEAVDPGDATCMGAAELDRLDPAALDDAQLADAFESASGLGEDARTVRFAAELARRRSPALPRLDLPALFAPLVREALKAHEPERAIAWLDRARAIESESESGRGRRTFDIWSAEVHARSGDPDAALRTYEALLEQAPTDAALALDAAETLLDNGYQEHARPLLLRARDQARRAGDAQTARRAQALVDHVGA